jgi:hypothetical protein
VARPDRPPGSDLDADLSVILDRAESIPAWVAIWQARTEPDAHARRCASDAIAAADDLLAATHRIRARLVGQVREADDQAAARVDELLARDGPRSSRPGAANRSTSTAAPGAEAMRSELTLGRRHGGGPREAAP